RRNQRHQRRLIDVAEIGMPAAGEEIELVALGIVAAGGRGVHDRSQECGDPDGRLAREIDAQRAVSTGWPAVAGRRADRTHAKNPACRVSIAAPCRMPNEFPARWNLGKAVPLPALGGEGRAMHNAVIEKANSIGGEMKRSIAALVMTTALV